MVQHTETRQANNTMTTELNLSKMRSEYGFPVQYFLAANNAEIYMNDLIGSRITIEYQHIINCVSCGKTTQRSYMNGHCYQCYTTLPECDEGVFNPEKDMAHLGISRDMEWSKKYSLIDHYVYLAFTGDLKVGVTRYNQIPTRWIDQGAIAAIRFAKTPNRNLAGQIEVEMKKHLADKTNWKTMLSVTQPNVDLVERKKFFLPMLPDDLRLYATYDDSVTPIAYPYTNMVANIKAVTLDKYDKIEGKLAGIKGQYLIFENGMVINVRSHSGYRIKLNV